MKTAMMAAVLTFSAASSFAGTTPVLADLRDLRALDIPVIYQDEGSQVGFAELTPEMKEALHERAHSVKKCGGFEDLTHDPDAQGILAAQVLQNISHIQTANMFYSKAPFKALALLAKPEVQSALDQVSIENLKSYVNWLSTFPSRNSRQSDPNVHVNQMKDRLDAMLGQSGRAGVVELINHSSTRQATVHVRLTGKTRPQEIVVLGGHLDSINNSWMGGKAAPGADDNASGSANLIEALRVLLLSPQTERSIDLFWYAGEEEGLLGSSEIAKQYKSAKQDVIAVLQLDMTLYPGAGPTVIGSMTDFTSAWLRDYLKAMNDTYLHVQVVDDKCGYGCSDHASWNRQGYATLMPFESTFRGMNPNIHTSKDTLSPSMNFDHAVLYTKIALVMALDLGNSTDRQPY